MWHLLGHSAAGEDGPAPSSADGEASSSRTAKRQWLEGFDAFNSPPQPDVMKSLKQLSPGNIGGEGGYFKGSLTQTPEGTHCTRHNLDSRPHLPSSYTLTSIVPNLWEKAAVLSLGQHQLGNAATTGHQAGTKPRARLCPLHDGQALTPHSHPAPAPAATQLRTGHQAATAKLKKPALTARPAQSLPSHSTQLRTGHQAATAKRKKPAHSQTCPNPAQPQHPAQNSPTMLSSSCSPAVTPGAARAGSRQLSPSGSWVELVAPSPAGDTDEIGASCAVPRARTRPCRWQYSGRGSRGGGGSLAAGACS